MDASPNDAPTSPSAAAASAADLTPPVLDGSSGFIARVIDNIGCGTLSQHRFVLLVLLSVTVAAVSDWLFWGVPHGWTIGAFGVLLIGLLLAWDPPRRHFGPVILLVLALLALCVQCVEQPHALVIAVGCLGLVTLGLLLREDWCADAITWLERWLLVLVLAWRSFFCDLAARYRHGSDEEVSRWDVRRLFLAWALPIALGAVFVVLFAAANPVLSRWLHDGWRAVHDWFEQLFERFPTPARIMMWLLVGLGCWTLLRLRSGIAARIRTAVATVAPVGASSAAVIVRCLAVFNVLFAVQTVLDVCYLWGGAALPDGMTYAQYAHRGAYPLIAAALLAAVFVLAAFHGDPRDRGLRLARGLVYLWLAQNLFLVVSAAWRLDLYVDAYTLTRLRVAAAIWMLLVFCGLGWILIRIVAGRTNYWLINVNAATALLALYACCFVDFNGFIARYNVAHCRELGGHGPPIDLRYLERLGPEALPALYTLAPHVPPSCAPLAIHGVRPADAPAVRSAIERLQAALHADLADWRGWTWRRQRLAESAPAAETVAFP